MTHDDPLIEIRRYTDPYLAHIASGYLEARGFHPVVLGDDLGGNRPHLSILTGVRLFVPTSEQDAAISALEKSEKKLSLVEDYPKNSLDPYKSALYLSVFALFIPLLPAFASLFYFYQARRHHRIPIFTKIGFWLSNCVNVANISFSYQVAERLSNSLL